jgi:hypothetical protein
MNLLIFSAAFATQYFIGAIIELFPTTASGGYAVEGYQLGFGLCLAAQTLGLIWYLLGFGSLLRRASPGVDAT